MNNSQIKFLKKIQKRERLESNKFKGKLGEAIVHTELNISGYDVRRKPHGQDFEASQKDFLTNRVTKKIKVEIKTGNASLSTLQKETRKKNPKNYKVITI